MIASKKCGVWQAIADFSAPKRTCGVLLLNHLLCPTCTCHTSIPVCAFSWPNPCCHEFARVWIEFQFHSRDLTSDQTSAKYRQQPLARSLVKSTLNINHPWKYITCSNPFKSHNGALGRQQIGSSFAAPPKPSAFSHWNALSNVSIWGWICLEPFHRVKQDMDMTYGSWIYGSIETLIQLMVSAPGESNGGDVAASVSIILRVFLPFTA